MKGTLKILALSIGMTVATLALLLFLSWLTNTALLLHMTYPIRLLRGTEHYEGETRVMEVFFILERFFIPAILLSSLLFLTWLRKKRLAKEGDTNL